MKRLLFTLLLTTPVAPAQVDGSTATAPFPPKDKFKYGLTVGSVTIPLAGSYRDAVEQRLLGKRGYRKNTALSFSHGISSSCNTNNLKKRHEY